ncbi:hypothetical protein SAMN04487765_1681 [Tenacibaculum sp. MAR_2010_89]|uniref:hypothetical protein n=1 Tax=Tenacibaculum sp. MAR_2010_89 TaxID=1250198 RepID=UPI000895B58D|nr:hypothetical protein [Tenacibaculum sp. MAR_2010_89]SEE18342.1 hypothetical protein SAMN04487765_1681 [Tenacibaculum sp. MAR_2010_89]
MIIISCSLEKNYKSNRKVAFIYKKKIFEIEGKYLTEDLSNKVYVLFDSIKINKNEIKNLVVEFPDEIYGQGDGRIYIEEGEDEEFYDEYGY